MTRRINQWWENHPARRRRRDSIGGIGSSGSSIFMKSFTGSNDSGPQIDLSAVHARRNRGQLQHKVRRVDSAASSDGLRRFAAIPCAESLAWQSLDDVLMGLLAAVNGLTTGHRYGGRVACSSLIAVCSNPSLSAW